MLKAYRGSPPHARGKASHRPGCRICRRITPACAGKRAVWALSFCICGGSPPHARGKACFHSRRSNRPGITPACAGKSSSHHFDTAAKAGSSPHARGKGSMRPLAKAKTWITPACAGKRSPRRLGLLMQRDHPRMRGEKIIPGGCILKHVGSPLHARGKDLESPGKSTFLLCRTSDFI